MATLAKAHRSRLRRGGLALGAVVIMLLTGCAAEAPGGNSGAGGDVEQPTQQEGDAGGALTAEAIVAAAEQEGLECAEKDPRLDDRAQVIVCKGDDYVIISATRLVDAGLVAEQTATAKRAACESGFKIDGTRFAVSGPWILAPGGGDDKNVETFDAAMKTLNLEWSLDAC